jgi:AraC family transcriptional regulator of adaptative response / DNA-3-methyladenine glycosylase II
LAGVGEWTAQYIAMRALGESDAFLAGDVGVQRRLARPDGQRPAITDILARAERWRPWRAYAVMHLWTSGEVHPKMLQRETREICHALTA